MPDPRTKEFRPVCKSVHEALGRGLPSGPFNFGLYFMKWFFVADGAPPPGAPRPKKPWVCTSSDETKVSRDRDFNVLLDNLDVSLALFNGSRAYVREIFKRGINKRGHAEVPLPSSWDRPGLEGLLQRKHQTLEKAARAFESLGYEYLCLERPLASPLVLGLGLEHPSEKGFRFDWTLGLPVIPASGLKGVVRLAWLVDELNRQPDKAAALSFAEDVRNQKFPPSFRTLFGAGGEKDAFRGRVIFLDAFPQTLPRLKAEIMNCHYPDYLNKGTRGPTEDQRPNPQKFWAVDPRLTDGRPLEFIFRLMLSPEVCRDTGLKEGLLQAFEQALMDHGLGAKTAIGHGRFQSPASEPTRFDQDIEQAAPSEIPRETPPAPAEAAVREVWEGAMLTWNPGKGELNATFKGKKAFAKGRDLVPEALHKRLFEKRKAVPSRLTVAQEGNLWRIEAIEEL